MSARKAAWFVGILLAMVVHSSSSNALANEGSWTDDEVRAMARLDAPKLFPNPYVLPILSFMRAIKASPSNLRIIVSEDDRSTLRMI